MYKSFRSPEEALGMLIRPILWVVLFGVGMGRLLAAYGLGSRRQHPPVALLRRGLRVPGSPL